MSKPTGHPPGRPPQSRTLVKSQEQEKTLADLEHYVRTKHGRKEFTILSYAADLLFDPEVLNGPSERWRCEFTLRILDFMAKYALPTYQSIRTQSQSQVTHTNLDVDVSGLLKEVLLQKQAGYEAIPAKPNATDAEFEA